MPDMNVKQLISHRMSVLGISKAEAARRAGQNSPSFINNVLLDRVENITHKNMQRIAKALDLDPMYLAKPDLYAQDYDVDFSDLVDPVIDRNQEAIAADNTGAQQRFQATGTGTDIETRRRMMGAKPQTMSPAAVAARVATRDAEAPAFPAKSLPVFASAQGGDDGSVIIGNEPIDWITRPEPLLTVADAYAVYITGDSMAPAFDHGDTALVHPHLPVGRGDDVIFQTDNRPGEGTWVVPGSHRMDMPTHDLREFLDDTLACQLAAQAGDMLLLSETLVHAGPLLKAGASPRYSLVYGYAAPFMQTWQRYDPPNELLQRVTLEQRELLTGEMRYGFRRGQF